MPIRFIVKLLKFYKEGFVRFLIVEDDTLAQVNLSYFLRAMGEVTIVATALEAKSILETYSFDIAFFDLDLEKSLAGLELLPLAIRRGVYSVVLSGREDEKVIEKAYAAGAFDYLCKPFNRQAFDLVIKKFQLVKTSSQFKDFFERDFVTSDADLIEQLEVLKEVVITNRPIYLRGATGTGKSYIAKLIHRLIHGCDEGLVHLSCAEIPENLLESELFGHEKGAFTGAVQKKQGKLELANGGTLFLDEVATMPLAIQKKLLRVIEEKKFTPLGSTKEIHSQFRLISATCDDLEKMVEEGQFRQDLYFRLEGHNIVLRDLAERKKDIPKLIRHFLSKTTRRVVFAAETMARLNQYHWPGNVRELQNLVEMMSAKSAGVITPDLLPAKFHVSNRDQGEWLKSRDIQWIEEFGLKAFIEGIENEIVSKFLELKKGKIRDAFGALQISSSSFYRIKERIDGEQKE